MKKRLKTYFTFFILFTTLIIPLTGCNSTEIAATQPTEPSSLSLSLTPPSTQTSTPIKKVTPTHTPSSTGTYTPTPTETPTSTRTPIPTVTASPTPTVISPEVVASVTVNVRAGPSTDYAVIASLPPDFPLPIVGRNEDGSWWKIEGPDGNNGWVADSVVEASNTTKIPLAESPPPLVTPTPTDMPLPDVDFRITFWRLLPLELNSGCAKGMHSIFITVLDAAGNPLNDIVVGDSWDNVETMTGSKGVGKAEVNLWTNTMEMEVKRDGVTGQPYTSEVSFPFSSFMTTIPNDQMVAAGYCANDLECDWKREHESFFCGGHYSWEVTFQRTW